MTDFKVVWPQRVLTHHSSKGAVALLKMRGEGWGRGRGREGKTSLTTTETLGTNLTREEPRRASSEMKCIEPQMEMREGPLVSLDMFHNQIQSISGDI